MICPNCRDEYPMVVDSRKKPYGVLRRRECLVCGYRYSTVEIDAKQYKLLRRMAASVLEIAEEFNDGKSIYTEEEN